MAKLVDELRQVPLFSGLSQRQLKQLARGFKEREARHVAHLIADLLDRPENEGAIAEVRAEVAKLTRAFPVYG